jgi:hypothetical protein
MMQYSEPALKPRHGGLSHDVRLDTEATLVRLIHTSTSREKVPCFMTGERLLCKNTDCEWREDCCKLVAVWRR